MQRSPLIWPALCLAFLGTLASCASSGFAAQRPPRNPVPSSHLDLHLGVRSLDEDDWWPVEDQGAIGFTFVHEALDSAVGFELGVFASGDEEEDLFTGGGSIDVEGETAEISLGLRKTFLMGEDEVHPYIGGGVSAIHAEFSSGGADDEDGSAGIYFHTGIEFDLGPNFLFGFDMRFLGATDIDMFGVDGSANYFQFALFLGVRF